MRIALVHYCCAPVVGGVETVIAEHARLLVAHGHEVTILCRRGALSAGPIRVEYYAAGTEPVTEARLEELLSGQDLVLAHNVLTMPFDPSLTEALWKIAPRRPQTRFVAWIHDLAACNPDYQVEPGALIAQRNPHFQYVAISGLRQREFEQLTGFRCQIIPNGIDPARFWDLSPSVAAFAAAHPILDGRLVLLQPTRLLQRKNVEFSLRVAAALKHQGIACALLITGPPDTHNPAATAYVEFLRKLHQELALQKTVWFLHDHFTVDDKDLRSLYQLSDAMLFPSRQEGFGLPLLEAALERLPVFCPERPPFNEVVVGAFHRFAPESAPQQVGRQIVSVCENNLELNTRKKVLRDYAWAAVYEKFLAPLLTSTASLETP